MRKFRQFPGTCARMFTAGLLTAVLFGAVGPLAAWAAETFSLEISVANSSAGAILKLGLADDATDGMDEGTDLRSPPPPPTPPYLSRIVFLTDDVETVQDYRQAADAKEWPLTVSIASGSPISLSWTSPGTTGFMAGKSLVLTGQGLNVNMVSETSAQITLGGDYRIILGGAQPNPVPISPSGDVEVIPPTFTWTAGTGAEFYQVQMLKDGVDTVSQWIKAPTTTWTPRSLGAGVYLWRVQKWSDATGYGAWSDTKAFRVKLQFTPSGTVNALRPEFTWNAVTGATWYQIYIMLADGTPYQEWVEGTTSWVPNWDLVSGAYKWYIQSYSAATGTGGWSSGLSFTVDVGGTLTPEQIAPWGKVTEAQPTFTWNAVEGATHYHVGIKQKDGWYYDFWVQNTTWAPTTWGFSDGSYTWWMQAWSEAGGTSAWSEGLSFTVELPGVVPVPQTPTGTVSDTTRPTFTWSAIGGATWYQLYIAKSTGDTAGWPWDNWVKDTNQWTTESWDFSWGKYTWYVRAWGSSFGYSDWSSGAEFEIPAPASPTPQSPSGTITESRPQFTWDGVDGATWYQIYFSQRGGWTYAKWHQGSTTWDSTFDFTNATYDWYVRGWGNTIGYTPWSSGLSFIKEE